MALTGWSAENYLMRVAAVTAARPVLLSAWVHRNNAANADARALVIGVDGQNNHRRDIGTLSAGGSRAQERDTSSSSANGLTPPTNAWAHIAGAFVGEALREVWLDGGGKGNQASTRNPTGLNATFIGINPDLTLPWHTTGGLAEASIWDLDGFSEADRDALVALLGTPVEGEAPNPHTVNAQAGQPWEGALIDPLDGGYASLRTLSDLGAYTMIGTLTEFASHPPVEEEPAGGGLDPAVISLVTRASNEITISIDSYDATASRHDMYRRANVTMEGSPQDTGTLVGGDINPDVNFVDDTVDPEPTYFYQLVSVE